MINAEDARIADPAKTVRLDLFTGFEAMTSYALESGMMLPDSVCADLAMIGNGFENCTGSTADLARLHSQLAQLVRSANPNTLRLLHEENGRHAAWRILGPLPSVRRLVSAALVFGVLFILTSLSDSINNENMQKDIYSSTGIDQLIVLLFLISAAGLGACSNVLYSISQSIAEGSDGIFGKETRPCRTCSGEADSCVVRAVAKMTTRAARIPSSAGVAPVRTSVPAGKAERTASATRSSTTSSMGRLRRAFQTLAGWRSTMRTSVSGQPSSPVAGSPVAGVGSQGLPLVWRNVRPASAGAFAAAISYVSQVQQNGHVADVVAPSLIRRWPSSSDRSFLRVAKLCPSGSCFSSCSVR